MAAHQDLTGQLGRYLIVRKLGAGGMGAVYLAEDSKIGRKVALKVPHFAADEGKVLDRFRREARLAAGIDHPNLCPVYDVEEVDGLLFFTMPFIEGTPLSRLIEEGKPWPAARAVELVHKLAAAVGHLHQRGIIHRDLKPQNVMIRPSGEPVLMDFGLARSVNAKTKMLTALGKPLGSPTYMAPEQVAASSRMGPATDVYGLGMILYQLLTGQLPFNGPLQTLFYQILSVPATAPSLSCPGLAPALDALCLKALSKKPEERHASADDFAAALATLQNIPVATPVATPIPTPPTLPPQNVETLAPVRVTCTKCGQQATVPATLSGRKVKCPSCGASLGVAHDSTAAQSRAGKTPPPWLVFARQYALHLGGAAALLVIVPLLALLLSGKKETPGGGQAATLHLRLPASVAVPQGRSVRFEVRLTRQRDNGAVQVILNGGSSGLSASGVIEANAERGTVELAANDATALGTSTVRLLAVSDRTQSEPVELDVTVTPAASLALEVSPTSLLLEPGQRRALRVSVTRRNCPGPVQVRGVSSLDVTIRTAQIADGESVGTVAVIAAETAKAGRKSIPLTASNGTIESDPVTVVVGVQHDVQTRPFTNSLGMDLVPIKAGKFRMGTGTNELNQLLVQGDYFKHEGPQHEVALAKSFSIGDTEVTVAQFRKFAEKSGYQTEAEKAGGSSWNQNDYATQDNQPVVYVSWNDADAFCKWLSKQEGRTYELPTEAEWEYACRAGTTTAYHFGDACNGKQANCDGNYPHGTTDVGPYLKGPRAVRGYDKNAWGLYDMHGNVWEWCQDGLREYQDAAQTDPRHDATGTHRSLRGGSWLDTAIYCRSAGRLKAARGYSHNSFGFRVVCRHQGNP